VPPLIPRREHFTRAERLSPAWTLMKDGRTATCEVWSHEFGFELRVLVGSELVQSAVCRSQDDLIRVQEEWRTHHTSRRMGYNVSDIGSGDLQ
jgi:hypothetical protein